MEHQREAGKVGIDYPELVVFDLDACLWDQEMYTMSALPDRTVTGSLNGKPSYHHSEAIIG
jgi:hypothetical protein